MSALSSILRSVVHAGGRSVSFWCPGCDVAHILPVEGAGRPCWFYNNNPDAPTFSPSILVTTGRRVDPAYVADPDFPDPPECCHSFVKDGLIQFLADCTHPLAGQTVPLPDWPPSFHDGDQE